MGLTAWVAGSIESPDSHAVRFLGLWSVRRISDLEAVVGR